MESRHWFFLCCVLSMCIGSSLQLTSNDWRPFVDVMTSQRRQELRLWCAINCVTDWSPWSLCSTPCGEGTSTRSRQRVNQGICGDSGVHCFRTLRQITGCNAGCPYGGISVNGRCSGCPHGRTGTCCETAVSCGDPGTPMNGFREGGVFTFGNKIVFHCERGYKLVTGSKEMECQSNAQWNGRTPTCKVCPFNSYMEEEECKECPEHSYTAANASTTIKQCFCDSQNGFVGPPGGPCEEIFCTELPTPDFGIKEECGNKVRDSCNFTCNPGFIIERGSSRRTCQENGEWDGSQASCVPCPLKTFKYGENTCVPCPVHSHTEDSGQMKTGCVCDDGYTGPPGGPCQDVDECQVNDGKGPCEDACENEDGGYRCRCTIPGYIADPTNIHKCKVKNQCRNLTVEDAPVDGGLVCFWYHELNSQYCTVKCNPGYEHAERVDNYEICGIQTNYTWTFQVLDPNAIISPCIAEFFPDMRMYADSNYFAVTCGNLSEDQKAQVKAGFASRLDGRSVCGRSKTKVCDAEDMAIMCGSTT